MNAGEILQNNGWLAHPRNGDHPLWSKDNGALVELSEALEAMRAKMADGFEATIRRERAAEGCAGIFVDGEPVRIPLERLIVEGEALIANGYPSVAPSFNLEMNAAATAVHWYDEQHQAYVEYESHKQEIAARDLPPAEYEAAIRRLAEALDV